MSPHRTDALPSAPAVPSVTVAGPRQPRLASWPLSLVLPGVLGLCGTLVFDTRAGDQSDPNLIITAADVAELENTMFRVGGFLGYLCVGALLVAAAVWHRRVALRYLRSAGAPVVTYGLVAAAATLTLAYGWKGALGNYLDGGLDENYYDATGLYVYYMLNDFGPFFGWLPVLFALAGMAWMALVEGLISKPLGVFLAALVLIVLGAVLLTGVPGLPFAGLLGLIIAGVWLAVGRSAISREPLS